MIGDEERDIIDETDELVDERVDVTIPRGLIAASQEDLRHAQPSELSVFRFYKESQCNREFSCILLAHEVTNSCQLRLVLFSHQSGIII